MSWRVRHPSTVVSRWPLQGAAGVITPDTQGRYPGTLVNAPTWSPTGPKNSLQCVELDGLTQAVNAGDVVELNAVSAFTVCFWMNQNILDAADYMMQKRLNASSELRIFSNVDGNFYVFQSNGGTTAGWFDYSLVVSAYNWHHIAVVFDGSQADNASRLQLYIDGNPIVLTNWTGTVQATTADLSGVNLGLGGKWDGAGNALDGRLWDYRLHSVALTRDEVNRIIHESVPVF